MQWDAWLCLSVCCWNCSVVLVFWEQQKGEDMLLSPRRDGAPPSVRWVFSPVCDTPNIGGTGNPLAIQLHWFNWVIQLSLWLFSSSYLKCKNNTSWTLCCNLIIHLKHCVVIYRYSVNSLVIRKLESIWKWCSAQYATNANTIGFNLPTFKVWQIPGTILGLFKKPKQNRCLFDIDYQMTLNENSLATFRGVPTPGKVDGFLVSVKAEAFLWNSAGFCIHKLHLFSTPRPCKTTWLPLVMDNNI